MCGENVTGLLDCINGRLLAKAFKFIVANQHTDNLFTRPTLVRVSGSSWDGLIGNAPLGMCSFKVLGESVEQPIFVELYSWCI